jgi:hypothetical protein
MTIHFRGPIFHSGQATGPPNMEVGTGIVIPVPTYEQTER